MKKYLYIIAIFAVFGCKKNNKDLSISETDLPVPEAISGEKFNSNLRGACGVIRPGVFNAAGAYRASSSTVFNLGAKTPSVFFNDILNRTAATALPGQFYCLGKNDSSYASTAKVLNKFGLLSVATTITLRSGGNARIPTLRAADWFSTTGGAYIPKSGTISGIKGPTTFPSKIATLGYKDLSGSSFRVYLTVGYSSSSGNTAFYGSEGAGGAYYTILNGNSNGLGRRWTFTCNPFADFSSGNYNVLTEIPGTSASRVGGSSNTAYNTIFADDIDCICAF